MVCFFFFCGFGSSELACSVDKREWDQECAVLHQLTTGSSRIILVDVGTITALLLRATTLKPIHTLTPPIPPPLPCLNPCQSPNPFLPLYPSTTGCAEGVLPQKCERKRASVSCPEMLMLLSRNFKFVSRDPPPTDWSWLTRNNLYPGFVHTLLFHPYFHISRPFAPRGVCP